jgi:alkanesulfonate monooxygenase SsuD/methylene tetrahydromethanopterin reductase-like flavin-dependent oxidoreductase (luciferase family)
MTHVGVLLPPLVTDAGDYLADAGALEAAGVHSIWLGEQASAPRAAGIPHHDVWTLMAAIAAVTSRVRLGSVGADSSAWSADRLISVLATLDALSRGRVMIGLAPAESGADAGSVAALVAEIRRQWRQRTAADPAASSPAPPVLLSAISARDDEQAACLADGVIHDDADPDAVARIVAAIASTRRRNGVESEVAHWVQVPSPRGREEWRQTLASQQSLGTTGIIVPFVPTLLDLLRNPDREDDRSDLLLASG